ncbi:MAG TPA: ATP-binding cassette domain-containing protein, partial [Puia sp.]|nr:ATP-binding cassette domain-containing protein [Puia sp.]
EMKAEPNNAVIVLRDVHKSFGKLEVLKGVDLDVRKGENVVVLGRSGSGKSVLIKIIAGLLKPDRGCVRVLGEEIDRLKPRELRALRSKIGFSFQSSALYDGMNVRANLEFPLVRNRRDLSRKEIDSAVAKVLDDVGLSHATEQMPSELSGGQKKRIGIARTLILQPEIMLYDEPTAGLDPVTSVDINELINEVQQLYNTSAVIITHDLTCARATGNRVVMLSEGRFLRQGSFEEVFESTDPKIRDFYNYNFITRT